MKLIEVKNESLKEFVSFYLDLYKDTWNEIIDKEYLDSRTNSLVEKEIQKEIENNSHFYFLKDSKDNNIGYIAYGPTEVAYKARIIDICILDEYRREGYASIALKRVEEMMRDELYTDAIFVCPEFNDGARRFFLKQGYVDSRKYVYLDYNTKYLSYTLSKKIQKY